LKPPTPAIFLPSVRPDWTGEITVRAPEDVWIANLDMEIELRGDGDLTLFRSTRGLGLVGRLEVVSGIYRLYYSWIANELRVEEGSIVWVDATDAQRFRISATASTEVDGERIELTVDGAPDSLNISATSESEYSQSEILRLLAIRDRPGESPGATPEILGSWVTTFSGLLTRELTRGFRGFGEVDIINLEGRPQLRVRRQIVRGVGVTYEQEIEGILGSQETSATESERLYVPDRQVKLEYRMTRAFYLEALTGALRDGSRVYDLDLKWRLSY
jgi:autotransporter translocation and assembly factor TamB